MHFFDDLAWRGLFQDISDEGRLRALKPGDAFYVGFDPSAPSLQVGNLVPLITALRLATHGLKPIILFGGATGAIGDPKAKSERHLLPREQIESNVARHQEQVRRIYGRLNASADFVDNFIWTRDLPVLDFLREIGKHFTLNYMLAKEVIKTRMSAEGISYTEFSYMLLQAHDFLYLYQNNGCKMQFGGSDQWGNITAGLELIRRKLQGDAVAFSCPLVTDSQGRKLGKTEEGTLWLDAEMTTPYRMHQYWLNREDDDIIKLLKCFTFLSHDEINELESKVKSEPEKREAQKRLADEIVGLIHGEQAAKEASRSARVLFGGSFEGITEKELLEIFSDVPSSKINREEALGLTVADLLAAAGLVQSKGEARRLIASGGAYLNNERITDGTISSAALIKKDSSLAVLRSGKKRYHLLKFV